MDNPIKHYLEIFILPLFFACIIICMIIVWKLLNLPPQEVLIPKIKALFETYGVALVFIAAILESAFVVGTWVPGSLVIFLGVIVSIGNPLQASLVICSVVFGFLIGFSIDYLLGKYGWYKLLTSFGFNRGIEKTKEKIIRYGISVPWIGYHNPDLGSFVATAYGILGYSYRRFLLMSIPPIILWCLFWGMLTYNLGNKALSVFGWKFAFIVLGVWVIARIIEIKINKKYKHL